MLDGATPVGRESVALDDATGRVLAEDIRARRDQPPFDSSAMDGWAIRTGDLPAPRGLRIAGESAAGQRLSSGLEHGQAARIFTGAPMPPGADRVVVQELAERRGDRVFIGDPGQQAWVRPRGGDFHACKLLLQRGLRINPRHLALAAAAGCAELDVARRPRVVILATGPELANAGEQAGPDQIYDSAGPAVASLARHWGATASRAPPLPDEESLVGRTVSGIEADVIVTIGGASVGAHDVVRPALARLGLAVRVESVAVKPGKPTWFGILPDGRRLLGLPGNPASALVGAELFLRPLVLALQGALQPKLLHQVRLAAAISANGPREHWLRARASWSEGILKAVPFADQDSSLVSVLANADLLVRHPAGAPAADIGQVIEALLLTQMTVS